MIRSMLAKEWMSPVETVSPDTPFLRALALMQDKDVHSLAVLENDRLTGIVNLGDIRHAMPQDDVTRRIWDINHTWDTIMVYHIMNQDVITIEPHTSVLQAARLMMNYHISRLPVVDRQGQLLGMLTARDIYRMLVALRESQTVEEDDEIAQPA